MGHHGLAQGAASPYQFEWCGAKLNTQGKCLMEQMSKRGEWLERDGSEDTQTGIITVGK